MNVLGTAAGLQAPQTARAAGAEAAANGGFLFPGTPNLVDFLDFLSTTVQIPLAALPANSPYPQYALDGALALVLQVPCLPGPALYSLVVYNCATHLLFGITPDQVGQTYFTQARSREGYALVLPSTGLVAASSDESTSATLASPEWARRLTPDQLDFYKTPWGRYYLGFQAKYGPTIVGLS